MSDKLKLVGQVAETREAGVSMKPGVERSERSPRMKLRLRGERAERATARMIARLGNCMGYRPLRGLANLHTNRPGAYAPGFTLSPASLAKHLTTCSEFPSYCRVLRQAQACRTDRSKPVRSDIICRRAGLLSSQSVVRVRPLVRVRRLGAESTPDALASAR